MTITDNTPVAPPAPVEGAERRHRGRLVLAEQVVEKIAGQVASEISAAGGRSGGFLGVGAHTDLSARPKVDVELAGRTATLAIEMAVAYPVSIRQATDRVRDRLTQRVGQLTGVEVTRVDITVVALHANATASTEELL
ncbi:MAG TPA: Asp23/Gls24 family envelope stress response protein [Microlunatus sp.]|nr:Asp23/Gls24 family envelope stress response protein [Microlunatus sp.]